MYVNKKHIIGHRGVCRKPWSRAEVRFKADTYYKCT